MIPPAVEPARISQVRTVDSSSYRPDIDGYPSGDAYGVADISGRGGSIDGEFVECDQNWSNKILKTGAEIYYDYKNG